VAENDPVFQESQVILLLGASSAPAGRTKMIKQSFAFPLEQEGSKTTTLNDRKMISGVPRSGGQVQRDRHIRTVRKEPGAKVIFLAFRTQQGSNISVRDSVEDGTSIALSPGIPMRCWAVTVWVRKRS
jgi:hypothetical protein